MATTLDAVVDLPAVALVGNFLALTLLARPAVGAIAFLATAFLATAFLAIGFLATVLEVTPFFAPPTDWERAGLDKDLPPLGALAAATFAAGLAFTVDLALAFGLALGTAFLAMVAFFAIGRLPTYFSTSLTVFSGVRR